MKHWVIQCSILIAIAYPHICEPTDSCCFVYLKKDFQKHYNELSSASSSSTTTAFHTLISVAMSPYNQSFITSFECCCCCCCCFFFFPLLRFRCGKRKEEKVEQKEKVLSQLGKEVGGSKIVNNHVNQLRSCSKSATGTGREPYPQEWTAIYVLSPLVPIQVGDTNPLQLAFWWFPSSRDATS